MISLSAWVLFAIASSSSRSQSASEQRSVGTQARPSAPAHYRLARRALTSRCCAVPPKPHSWHRLLLSMGEGPRLCVTSRAPPSTTTVTS